VQNRFVPVAFLFADGQQMLLGISSVRGAGRNRQQQYSENVFAHSCFNPNA